MKKQPKSTCRKAQVKAAGGFDESISNTLSDNQTAKQLLFAGIWHFFGKSGDLTSKDIQGCSMINSRNAGASVLIFPDFLAEQR